MQISDDEAESVWKEWPLKTKGLTPRNILSAVKIYIAVSRELDQDPDIVSVGINCLNEFALLRYDPLPGLEHAL